MHAVGAGRLAAVLLASLVSVACVTGGQEDPPEFCVAIRASDNLNLFDEQSHVVVLSFYPLRSDTAFLATDPRRLIDGDRPPGLTGDPWEITVLPGEVRELDEKLPRETGYVGVVADFYRGPSTQVVEAECAMFGRRALVLSQSDLQVE